MKTLCLVLCLLSVADARARSAFPVTVQVETRTLLGRLPPIWRFFGADEPNYATAPEGERLLGVLGDLRHGEVYFRAHHLLTSGDGVGDFKWGSTNIFTERDGKASYDFRIVDQILDTYLARGLHPYLEMGFMPEALSAAPPGVPYRRPWQPGVDYRGITAGWSYPPRDYARWAELVYRWTRHNVERYGSAEVQRWYFEVWNEPNLDFYWSGTAEEFYRLHDLAVDAIRRALPTARVGGPDVAGSGGAFMGGFLRHITTGRNYATGEVGTPTDFLSFHAKGAPTVSDGHVRMGIAQQLRTVDEAFDTIAAFPQLAGKTIVIGENDPEGCAACPGPDKAYRNGTLYSSYTAAVYARLWQLARQKHVNLEGAVTWAFTFIHQPWFAGYRQLATNNVDLPVLNVFRLLARLGGDEVAASSTAQVTLEKVEADGISGAPDVGVLATRSGNDTIAILLWHYQDEDVPGPAAEIRLKVLGVPSMKHFKAQVWRVDQQHGDAFSAWRAMGSPSHPSKRQLGRLLSASRIQSHPLDWTQSRSEIDIKRTLPLQAVELIELRPK